MYCYSNFIYHKKNTHYSRRQIGTVAALFSRCSPNWLRCFGRTEKSSRSKWKRTFFVENFINFIFVYYVNVRIINNKWDIANIWYLLLFLFYNLWGSDFNHAYNKSMGTFQDLFKTSNQKKIFFGNFSKVNRIFWIYALDYGPSLSPVPNPLLSKNSLKVLEIPSRSFWGVKICMERCWGNRKWRIVAKTVVVWSLLSSLDLIEQHKNGCSKIKLAFKYQRA